MEQFFAVTVRENNSGALVYNTSAKPEELEKLDIKNLSAGMSYIATVSRGKIPSQWAEAFLSKILGTRNKTYLGLISMLQGFQKYIA